MNKAEYSAAIPSLGTKKVLVTGSSGFIGSSLCARLAKDGAEVHGISRKLTAPPAASVRMWQADVSDFGALRHVFSEIKPHIVFHLAGHVQGSRNLDQVGPTLSGNLLTAVNMLTIGTEIGCERIVLTGSQDEPDPGESGATEFVPSSPYAASKLAGSAYARMFRMLYQSPVTIGRIFMAYGPAQRDLKKLIPYVILCLLRGQAPKLSSGARPLDWIYIDDVIDGLILLSQSPNVLGQTVHLGTGVTYTAREAVEKLVLLTDSSIRPIYGALEDRQLERGRFANVVDTQAKIGWGPKVTFDEGLRRTISWYREQLRSGALGSM